MLFILVQIQAGPPAFAGFASFARRSQPETDRSSVSDGPAQSESVSCLDPQGGLATPKLAERRREFPR